MGYIKMFWKMLNGGKMGSCSRINDTAWRIAVGQQDVPKTMKGYFEYLNNMSWLQSFRMVNGVGKGNYFGEESIRRIEMEAREKLKQGKDDITRGMIKTEGELVIKWVWKICSMVCEGGAVPQDIV